MWQRPCRATGQEQHWENLLEFRRPPGGVGRRPILLDCRLALTVLPELLRLLVQRHAQIVRSVWCMRRQGRRRTKRLLRLRILSHFGENDAQ